MSDPISLTDGLVTQGGLLRWRVQNGVIVIETINGAVMINSMEPQPQFVAMLRGLADKIETDHAAYLAFMQSIAKPDPSASENTPVFADDVDDAPAVREPAPAPTSSGGFPLGGAVNDGEPS